MAPEQEQKPPQEQKPAIEYNAQAVSPIVNGEAKLNIAENSFFVKGVFDIAEIPYAKVNALEFADYTTVAKTDEGDFVLSRMGNWAQPFYDSLCDAYNKAVLRSFFVTGNPVFTASGDYRLAVDGAVTNNKAPIRLFADCIAALPPNCSARRIPLCFVNGIEKGDFSLTLKLNLGEEYTFSKLGYDTARFAEMIEKNIRTLYEKANAVVKEIDPTLSVMQASQAAKLVPQGAAAQMGQFAAVAPSLAAAIEDKITKTRAVYTYAAFKEVCDPAKIWVGFKKNDIRSDGKPPGITQPGEEEAKPDPYLFWMIAPSPDERFMAVEFAVRPGESAATFVYNTGGNFLRSAALLNRALEAITFKREVIPMTEEELRLPENVDYYMAAKRTASLQYIRKNFVGRVIHYNPEAWKSKLLEMWGSSVVPD